MNHADRERWETIIEHEMLGDAVDAEDQAFRASYERAHPECQAETEAWGNMLGMLHEEGDAEGRAHAESLAERVLVQRDVERGAVLPLAARRPRPRRAVWVATSLAAAAAIAGLVIVNNADDGHPRTAGLEADQPTRPAPTPHAPVQEAAPTVAPTPTSGHPVGLLAMAGAGLLVDGGPASAGAEIQPGQQLSFDDNGSNFGADACVVYQSPWITACFSRASEVVFAAGEDAGERRLELRRGRVLVTLDELPPGQRFSVVTSKGSVAAIGTSFEVWIDDRGTVRASVLDGKVEITDDGPRPRNLTAGQTTVLGSAETGGFGADALAWSRGHARLAGLRRSPERGVIVVRDAAQTTTPSTITLDALPVGDAPVSLLAPQGEHVVAMAGTPRSLPVEVEAGSRHELTLDGEQKTRRPRNDGPSSASRPTVEDLVRKASEAQADHRYKDAGRYLDKLLRYYPDGPDAQNARVQLGDLQREKLGKPGPALALYDAYLRRGGPLTPEARYGRIQALSRLGRAADERAAIDAFVAKHPKDWRTAELRERLR